MNGAEAMIRAAVSQGVEVCFANPGTTELPMVAALDSEPGLRAVLCLHENVATGASDGYARMKSKPAVTILHLGPGLGNGLTNLHNARRAGSPIVNLVGDHATWHLAADPPLATDIGAIAGAVSGFFRQNTGANTIAQDMADAVAASMDKGGQVATLVIPHDAQWTDTEVNKASSVRVPERQFSADNVVAATAALNAGKAALYLGGDALLEDGLLLAGRIAEATGADLICETFYARLERGGGLPIPTKLPYFPEMATALLTQYNKVVVVASKPPVAFFGYPDGTSQLTSDDQAVMLTGRAEDTLGALEALATAVNAPGAIAPTSGKLPPMPAGPLTPEAIGDVIANLQPEGAILVDEGITASTPYEFASCYAPRFTQLQLTGGAIGMGPSVSTGAAIACPDRRIIDFQADGSGAYSVQALWTQARENLDVVTVLCSNRTYNVLGFEMHRAGYQNPGPSALSVMSLDNPAINWVDIASGFGVTGEAVSTAEEFARALNDALAQRGPRLIEVQMP